MEPIISHRCQKCGAAIRAGAKFCPQCGTQDGKPESGRESYDAAEVTDAVIEAEGKPTKKGSTVPAQPFNPEMRDLPFVVDESANDKTGTVPEVGNQAVSTKTVVDSNAGHSKTQRVKDAARGIVEENVRPRVEKLRHASSVVFEEASAIEPSLRFVLIALFLFIVFIALLVLSFIR